MEDYDVYEYDEWYWDSIPNEELDLIYDTAEELGLKDWDEQYEISGLYGMF